jgi:hypothetical protein
MEYEVKGKHVLARRRVLDFAKRRFCDGESFGIEFTR